MEFWEQFLIKSILQKMNNLLSELEKNTGIKFKNKNLIEQAFIHRSFLNEAKGKSLESNERLEFLGDSILSFWVSQKIFARFPDFPEGKLTFIKTYLVRTETLALLAQKLSLGEFLKLSKGEEAGGGKSNPNLLANCFEALVGAIFLDQGSEIIFQFLDKQFTPLIEEIKDVNQFRDSKSLFQEKVQALGLPTPVYRQLSSFGPDHQKTFVMGVFVKDVCIGEGASHSKQEAEELAAQQALEKNNLEKLLKIK